MEIQIGAAKVPKYATSESGDTLEIIERPFGGLSAVLVDGQRSGRAAKIISNIVARKAISLLGEGVRDGAAARAAHDYLRTHRNSQVSAELQLVSADLATHTLVISRNSQCPVVAVQAGQAQLLDAPSQPIGIYAHTKPVIVELPIEADMYVVALTDGAYTAGSRKGTALDWKASVQGATGDHPTAQVLADLLLAQAMAADDGRPDDDMSVLVVAVSSRQDPERVRRFSVTLPC